MRQVLRHEIRSLTESRVGGGSTVVVELSVTDPVTHHRFRLTTGEATRLAGRLEGTLRAIGLRECAGCNHHHRGHAVDGGPCCVISCECTEFLAELPNVARGGGS